MATCGAQRIKQASRYSNRHGASLGEFGCLACFMRFNLGNRAAVIFGALRVVIRLQVQPELMRRAEKTRETKRCARTDAAPTAHDLIDTRRRDIQGARNYAPVGALLRIEALPGESLRGKTVNDATELICKGCARYRPGQVWRPHGDSNPGSHRERVVS